MGIRDVLVNIPLRKLTSAQLVSMCGDLVAIFAVFSVVSFQLHANASQVSGIMIAYLLPQALVGPLGGVFLDRWNVKTTMILSDLSRAVLVVFLVYSSNIWQIYGVMTLLSAVSAFFLPAQTIALRAIVPVTGLMAANALMMQVTQVTQIVTPGLAGLLISRTGAAACFWLDSASFLFSAAVVSTVLIPPRTVPAAKAMSSLMADLTLGGRYIFTRGVLAFAIFSMAVGGFAVGCYNALIATYVRDILHSFSELFGLLGTLAVAGMILGTHRVTRLGQSISKEHLIVLGLFGTALGILLLAIFASIPLAVIATLAMGVGVAFVIIPAQTLMQSETPVEMLGRVSGSVRSVLALMQIGGLVLSGSIAQAIGIQFSFFAVSVLVMLIAILGLRVVHQRQSVAAVG